MTFEVDGVSVPCHVFKDYISTGIYRSICKDCYYFYPRQWWEKEHDRYNSDITINEVLSLMKTEGDVFYAFLNTDFCRFTPNKDGMFTVGQVAYWNVGGIYNEITKERDCVNKLNIYRFDLETVRRVLVEVRKSPIILVKKFLLNDLKSMPNMYTDTIMNSTVILYSALNMSLQLTGNIDTIYNEMRKLIVNMN